MCIIGIFDIVLLDRWWLFYWVIIRKGKPFAFEDIGNCVTLLPFEDECVIGLVCYWFSLLLVYVLDNY